MVNSQFAYVSLVVDLIATANPAKLFLLKRGDFSRMSWLNQLSALFKLSASWLSAKSSAAEVCEEDCILHSMSRRLKRTKAYTQSLRDRAGRLVVDLGLHLDPSHLLEKGYLTSLDGYVRSRAFWGIWSLDKEVGAILGRPSLVDLLITCPRPPVWQEDDFVSLCLRVVNVWLTCEGQALARIGPERSYSTVVSRQR